MNIKKAVRKAVVAAMCVCACGTAHAAKHALLVGVGTYSQLQDADLHAPANDVAIMGEVIQRMGVPATNITVLSTRVNAQLTQLKSSGLPTRAAILSALDEMVQRVKAGDQAVIYISSHGTQQPDQPKGMPGHDEADGLDEVILPSDASRWDPQTGTVVNGIVDEELGARVNQLRAAGASIWMIVDACHSGTALRAGGARVRNLQYKYVDPKTLGIPMPPPSSLRSATSSPMGPSLDFDRTRTGGLVAFYAVAPDLKAQAGQWLQPDGEYSTTDVSLLTYAISTAAATGNLSSYRDLAQRVAGVYALNQPELTPQFEGEFNRPVLGEGLVAPISWDVEVVADKLQVRGGQLDFIENGTVVRVINSHLPEQVGVFEVRGATPSEALLAPISGTTSSEFIADVSRKLRAELISFGAGNRIGISIVGGTTDLDKILNNVARDFASQPSRALTITTTGQAADIVVRAGTDRIWIAPASTDPALFQPGERRQPPYVLCTKPDAQCTKAFSEALSLLVRANRIVRVLNRAGGPLESRVRVETSLKRSRSREGLTTCDTSLAAPSGTDYAPLAPNPLAPVGTPAGDCDELWLRVTYAGTQALDVTPIYIAIDGSISVLDGDTRRDEQLRLLPGETRQFSARIRTSKGQERFPVGLEAAMLIAVEQSTSSAPRTYRWLATPGQATAVLKTRGASDALALALAGAEQPGLSRGDVLTTGQTMTAIRIPIDVQPR